MPSVDSRNQSLFKGVIVTIKTKNYLVTTPGLEPGIFGLKGRRVDQFHYAAKWSRELDSNQRLQDMSLTREPLLYPAIAMLDFKGKPSQTYITNRKG